MRIKKLYLSKVWLDQKNSRWAKFFTFWRGFYVGFSNFFTSVQLCLKREWDLQQS